MKHIDCVCVVFRASPSISIHSAIAMLRAALPDVWTEISPQNPANQSRGWCKSTSQVSV